uniref:Uncharacterized protein n=1 Tax=Phanerochaete carnosa TaxID=231932 RepID=A0A895KWZ4_9APHY|nr:hypothetical protein K8K84_mgp034 [Phanerochaete carnosa]QRZ60418.1 hypothetical protein [Phanerochaete carnosa]
MLSLKSLQAELDQLKNSNKLNSQYVSTQTKESKLKEGSMYLLLFLGFIVSYAHKIPIIGKIVKLLSLWYGRTTWWQILVRLRKIFIVFNSLIGILFMFKVTGFSMDNIIAGVSGMGAGYVEMFLGFVRKLFNWLYSFFDDKVVPDIPQPRNPVVLKKVELPLEIDPKVVLGKVLKPSVYDVDVVPTGSLRDLYLKEIKAESKWYDIFRSNTDSWIPSWLWYTGIAVVSVGAIFVTYKLVTDPEAFLEYIWPRTRTTASSTPSPDINLGDGRTGGGLGAPDAATGAAETGADAATGAADAATGAADAATGAAETGAEAAASSGSKFTPGRGFRYIGESIVDLNRKVVNTLNPFNYIATSVEMDNRFRGFLDQQTGRVNGSNSYLNENLYPYTENNPFDSYATKLAKAFFGETAAQNAERMQHLSSVNRNWDYYWDTLRRTADAYAETPSGARTPISPVNVGLNPGFHSENNFYDQVRAANLTARLSELPEILKESPVEGNVWEDHVKGSDAGSSGYSAAEKGKMPVEGVGSKTYAEAAAPKPEIKITIPSEATSNPSGPADVTVDPNNRRFTKAWAEKYLAESTEEAWNTSPEPTKTNVSTTPPLKTSNKYAAFVEEVQDDG